MAAAFQCSLCFLICFFEPSCIIPRAVLGLVMRHIYHDKVTIGAKISALEAITTSAKNGTTFFNTPVALVRLKIAGLLLPYSIMGASKMHSTFCCERNAKTLCRAADYFGIKLLLLSCP